MLYLFFSSKVSLFNSSFPGFFSFLWCDLWFGFGGLVGALYCDLILVDVCQSWCVSILVVSQVGWVTPSPFIYIYSLGKGWYCPSLGCYFMYVVCIGACLFSTLFFLARGEAYESPGRTRRSRLKSQVGVTTACYCRFVSWFQVLGQVIGKGFVVTKPPYETNLDSTCRWFPTQQASSDCDAANHTSTYFDDAPTQPTRWMVRPVGGV